MHKCPQHLPCFVSVSSLSLWSTINQLLIYSICVNGPNIFPVFCVCFKYFLVDNDKPISNNVAFALIALTILRLMFPVFPRGRHSGGPRGAHGQRRSRSVPRVDWQTQGAKGQVCTCVEINYIGLLC